MSEFLKQSKINTLTFLLIGVFFSFNLSAQNWNVFNKNYRYNYNYNNNALVTNVLFVDSIKQNGSDTLYRMNRIGVECTGTCPTITTAITNTGTVIVANMPQFLQRTIIKYANGLVMLKDTAKQILKPNCILNETWLFDSVNNKNAQCINLSTQTIFAITDSIKTILIDGTDTLKLSKQFGIVQFPNLYNKNKYYRLVGIENKSTFDQNALYGLKVPNGWDLYNFDVGDKFCYSIYSSSTSGPSNNNQSNSNESIEIVGKTTQPNVGYSYTVIKKTQTNGYHNGQPTNSSFTNTLTNLNYSLTLNEFFIYPGQIFTQFWMSNIAKFGKDNNNRFYKYAGPNCQNYTNVILPNINETPGYLLSNNIMTPSQFPYNGELSYAFGEGLGLVTAITDAGGQFISKKCLTCAFKNGSLYLGADNFVGLTEIALRDNQTIVYPNPTSGEVTIDSKKNEIIKVELLNSIGQLILIKEIDEATIKLNLQDYNSGIYFVKIYNKSALLEVKKIVKE